MDDQTEQDEKPGKTKRNASEMQIKHTAALLLNEQGMGPAAIGKALDYHEKHVANILPKLRRESLSAPHRVKLAAKTVDAVMQGFAGVKKKVKEKHIVEGVEVEVEKEVIEQDQRVKASDAMRAAELVYSRHEPVKPDPATAGGASQTFIQVNMQTINNLSDKDRAKISE